MAWGSDRDVIQINLYGGLHVSCDETDATPSSAKACGLIALLATHPNLKRSRVWLQDKLWSDRGREQGAASLRQALVQIRQSFGDLQSVLGSDRRHVWLKAANVVLVEPSSVDEEFLQGIDVKDSEFEDWLRQKRQSGTDRPVGAPELISAGQRGFVVVLAVDAQENSALGMMETLFGDFASKCLSEMHSVLIFRGETDVPADLVVRITAFKPTDSQVGLRVILEQPRNLSVWSNWCVVEARGAIPVEHFRVLALANELSMEIGRWCGAQSGLSSEQKNATLMCFSAIREMYRFDAESMRRADTLFAAAYEADPKGRYLAWRANLRVIEYVERQIRPPEHSREEGLELIRRALAEEPENSVVLALAADANLVFRRDVLVCDELSKRSIRINPASPLGWWSQATARLYGKKYDEANILAHKARSLAGNAPHRFWWDFQCALTSAATGSTEQAIREAEISSTFAPNFKAPLRYLTALYALSDDMPRARDAVERLKKIEPDFSPDRMANDAQYPVGLMRDNGFLDRERIRALS